MQSSAASVGCRCKGWQLDLGSQHASCTEMGSVLGHCPCKGSHLLHLHSFGGLTLDAQTRDQPDHQLVSKARVLSNLI